MTGETGHKLRGDYSRMRPDHTVDQEWEGYSPDEHALWPSIRRLAIVPTGGHYSKPSFALCSNETNFISCSSRWSASPL